eukprot:Tbor_TRINITY_DN5111_c0_g3::TRINITY_DN5111_c0_g3_i1::g.26071::m.26071
MPKKSKESNTFSLQLPPVPEHLFVRYPKRWVVVHFKLMGFSALDGEVRLPSDVSVRMVELKIISHHGGSVEKLTLWRDRIEPSCVVRDLSLSLRDLFQLNDAQPKQLLSVQSPTYPPEQAEDHHVLIYYDYRPHDSDCPLLLRSPRYPNSAEVPSTEKK